MDTWREYEQILCDAFSSMCGIAKRMEAVKKGENAADISGSRFAVGVLADYPGCSHALSQRLTRDVNQNWGVISQNL